MTSMTTLKTMTMTGKMTTDKYGAIPMVTLEELVESQLETWPDARRNYAALRETERRRIPLGDLDTAIQLNPARIRSTGAAVDKASVEARPCFLCAANRPMEQFSAQVAPEWELLVTPFPILPMHFTIVSKTHEPQGSVPLDMATIAERLPGMAVFFNGARAGASAPDHLHLQAVLRDELPLLRLAEKRHDSDAGGFLTSEQLGLDVPFQFVSGIITPGMGGMVSLLKATAAFGIDARTGQRDPRLVNAFFWTDVRGLMRVLIVPRRAHRPPHYFLADDKRLVISPGAIDMAGIMITPRREDFSAVTSEIMRDIYGAVAFADSLPREITEHFKTV